MCGQAGPATVPLQYAGRHQHRRREIVGELFHPVASCVARLFVVRGWHRVPGKDVKQLVCEIEMTAAGHFTPCDQDCIQFRKTAGRPRDAGLRVHHEHQDCEFPLHHFAQTRRRDIAQGEFCCESFAGMHGFLETGLPAEPKRPAHKRGAVSHLRCQIPECSDPASGSAFVSCELASLNPGVSPAEAALPDQQKRIREVFQGSTQHLACAHQFVGGYSPDARLYGRDSLSILEAEETGKAVLGELALFAQRIDACADGDFAGEVEFLHLLACNNYMQTVPCMSTGARRVYVGRWVVVGRGKGYRVRRPVGVKGSGRAGR